MSKPNTDDLDPSWLAALSGEKHSRIRATIATSFAALGAYRQVRTWLRDHEEKQCYTVSVQDIDEVYPDLHAWVLQQLPSVERRSVRAYTRRVRDGDDATPVNERQRSQRRVHLMYDGSRVQDIQVGGHTVQVSVEEPEGMRRDDSGGRRSRYGKPGELNLRCRTVEARDAVLDLLVELTDDLEQHEKTHSRVHIATKWDSWNVIGGTTPRPLSSVVLRGDLRESLVEDLQLFLSQEETYIKLGIPWHRGYLLHGPPGTGKTSFAQALAGHLDLDVYYVPLSDLETDTDLAGLLSRIEPRSMLLLEDVDVAHAARDRDDTEKGISLSGLLNALDGVITPHGLITVMTTNDLAALDIALTRPGRSDRVVSIDYADADQVMRLVDELLGISSLAIPTLRDEHRITPAEIVEAIKPHLHEDDPVHAVASVAQLLRDRVQTPHEADPLVESAS